MTKFITLILLISTSLHAREISEHLPKKIPGHKLVKSTKSIVIFESQKEDLDGIVPIISYGVIKAPVLEVAYILGESKDKPKWIPKMLEAKILREKSLFDRTEYTLTELPWPFDNREFLYEVKASYYKKPERMYIQMYSIDHPYPTKEGVIRSNMKDGSIELKAITPELTLMHTVVNVNPKGNIPGFIRRWAQRKWPLQMLKGLQKRIKTLRQDLGDKHPWLSLRKKVASIPNAYRPGRATATITPKKRDPESPRKRQ